MVKKKNSSKTQRTRNDQNAGKGHLPKDMEPPAAERKKGQFEEKKTASPRKYQELQHHFRQLYLYAFATQSSVLDHVKRQVIEAELGRLPEILRAWEGLQGRVETLVQNEGGLPDTIQ